jgi:hypothetical protein
MDLAYRSFVLVEDLQPGECTVHRAKSADGANWWLLWMHVYRQDRPGVLIDLAVPVAPHASYTETGPGGRTWGLAPAGSGRWLVSPSVDAKSEKDPVPGHAQDTRPSIWHKNPVLVGVPDGEAWQTATP